MRRNLRIFIALAAVATVADQLTKMLAAYFLSAQGGGDMVSFAARYYTQFGSFPFSPGRPVHIWDPWISMSFTSNTGMAWGMLHNKTLLLAFVSLLLSVVICGLWARFGSRSLLLSIALGLVLGGAVGNMLDRFRLREVVDFIDVLIPVVRYDFPVFNVADSCASIGTLLIAGWLVYGDIRASRRRILLRHDCTAYLP
jgi:signal peptidase II